MVIRESQTHMVLQAFLVLREGIGLARQRTDVLAQGQVRPFERGRVDGSPGGPGLQPGLHGGWGPEHDPVLHVHHPALLTPFHHDGVQQVGGSDPAGVLGSAGPTGAGKGGPGPLHGQERLAGLGPPIPGEERMTVRL